MSPLGKVLVNGKILIVGNGPSALENKYGELIDSGLGYCNEI